MLVRGKLPPAALRALRLVCRAARDDLVDARCTALKARPRPRVGSPPDVPPTKALISGGLAARLRSLTSLDASGAGSCCDCDPRRPLVVEDCEELATALEQLPNPAALTSLDLGALELGVVRGDPRCPFSEFSLPAVESLATALGRCKGLRALRFSMVNEREDGGGDDGGDARRCLEWLLHAARRLPALRTLGAAIDDEELCCEWPYDDGAAAKMAPWRRLEALDLGQSTAWLLRPAARRAAAPNLSSLSVDFSFFPLDASAAAVWRAPWLVLYTLGANGPTQEVCVG